MCGSGLAPFAGAVRASGRSALAPVVRGDDAGRGVDVSSRRRVADTDRPEVGETGKNRVLEDLQSRTVLLPGAGMILHRRTLHPARTSSHLVAIALL
jgi:hypothetical protein